jgi:hypothetical protein
MDYYPCCVVLTNGSVIDGVYVTAAQPYLDCWTVWPDQDPGKNEVKLQDVAEIRPSPNRIPPQFANKLHLASESGMGYLIFTAKFNDGSTKAYVVGNVVDFVVAPPGLSVNDIVDVQPHVGRETADETELMTIHWCIYGSAEPKDA